MRASELIMYILAVLSAGYGIFVRAAGSGTSFFLVWFALAVVLILFGISLHIRLWKKVPVWGRRIFTGIVVLGLAAFVIVEGCVISHMEDRGEDGLDYYRQMFTQWESLRSRKQVVMFLEMMSWQQRILEKEFADRIQFETIKTFHFNIIILKASFID